MKKVACMAGVAYAETTKLMSQTMSPSQMVLEEFQANKQCVISPHRRLINFGFGEKVSQTQMNEMDELLSEAMVQDWENKKRMLIKKAKKKQEAARQKRRRDEEMASSWLEHDYGSIQYNKKRMKKQQKKNQKTSAAS